MSDARIALTRQHLLEGRLHGGGPLVRLNPQPGLAGIADGSDELFP